MELLKFELFSKCSTFRVPLSIKGIETYPLPPYSTIIGLLYTAIGRKWEGEKFSISVQGNYDSIFRDYLGLKKYNRDKKKKKLETLPLQIPRLYNLRCIVHISSEDRGLLEEFKKGLESPEVYLFLSGGEYPVLVKNVKILRGNFKCAEGETRYSIYVPEEKKNLIWERWGIHLRIPRFCKRVKGERECEWVDVYYFSKGAYYEGEILIDEEGTPVWL